ncbi:MAG: hypothetical protein A2X45_11765 [Lentisphaerae bacterium GWF2_50_93]|nr:MAG: hypothetical protein A2X45_11765 [Lentisphaerae bacterium GWF2_50_93]
MVDMEGVSGICRVSQVMQGQPDYDKSRKYITWDVNSCVKGCFDGGAKRVLVRDAHCTGFNLLWDELDPRAEYIQGDSGTERMPGLDSFDGMILLGYHAMAGTSSAVLEHTMSSAGWQHFWLNGAKAGEIAIDAGIAGDHNVPVIMVSGDDKACAEARRLLRGVVTAEVKKGLSREGAILLAKDKAHMLIAECAAAAVRNFGNVKPLRIRRPVKMRLELVSKSKVPGERDNLKVINGRTYEVTGPDVEKALKLL